MEHGENETFGELLQRFRKRARLTQQALAERLGAHRSTVSFWERGEYMPDTLATVLELARVIQLSDADQRLLVEARFGTASILPWHNLPEPNPYFTGRDKLLEQLHTALTTGEPVALIQPQAISGLGGIGKTQLALAYAYRYRQHYHDILWALAESSETLVASYVAFAEQLRLHGAAEQDQRRVVEAVKRWLRDYKGWLLILDNLEDLALARAFVPTPRQGAVILTTRRAETSPVARPLPLDVLDEEEGVLFLLRRARLLPLEAAFETITPRQRATASAIVATLGGLPLALDQAGAYIADTRCGLSDYLALLQQERLALLHRRGVVSSEHPQSVTTTFSLAFAQVQQQNKAASEILRLCAFLAPEAIPLDLLSQGADDLGPVLEAASVQALSFNAALETLQAYSLVRREAEPPMLSLHRLVQAVQQEALAEDEQRQWAERAVRLVSAAFPVPDPVTWERCQQLVPHALVCAEHIARWGWTIPEGVSLLHQTGRYLYERGAYEQSLPLLQQALALRELVSSSDYSGLATSLNDLGDLYLARGQYEQALPLYERALAIREQTLGPTHPDVAQSLNNLALLYHNQGQDEQALPLNQRALAINEQALGPTHPIVAQTLNNLAIVYYSQGRYAEAVPLYQQALVINEQVLGPEHPGVARCLSNLATVYRIQERFGEALILYQQALAIREQVLGPAHPDVAWSLNGLAELYRARGQYEQALLLATRGLEIREQALGAGHPDVAISLNTLAHLYHEQRRYVEAIPLAERALAIREQMLGLDRPDVAESLNTLARLYEAQGREAEALPLYQRALTILKQALPNHPNITPIQERLEALLHRMERAKSPHPGELGPPDGVLGVS